MRISTYDCYVLARGEEVQVGVHQYLDVVWYVRQSLSLCGSGEGRGGRGRGGRGGIQLNAAYGPGCQCLIIEDTLCTLFIRTYIYTMVTLYYLYRGHALYVAHSYVYYSHTLQRTRLCTLFIRTCTIVTLYRGHTLYAVHSYVYYSHTLQRTRFVRCSFVRIL